MKREDIPKSDPRQLRMRALELKGKAAQHIEEADRLERQAEELERTTKMPREDFSQAAVRVVREATKD